MTSQASWSEAPVTDLQGQMGVIPSPRLTLWLDERADRLALADVAAAEGFPE